MPVAKRKTAFSETQPQVTRPLTKSRFKMALECPTKLFYTGKKEYANAKNDDPFLKALAKGGFQVGKLAQIYYGPGIEVLEREYEKAEEQTRLLLIQPKATIFEGAVRFQNHFIKADILKLENKTLEIIEVKAKGWPPGKDLLNKAGTLAASSGYIPYLYDIAYQTWVAKNAFPDFHVVPFLCLMNKEAQTSIDGLNQKFKLIRDGKTFSVKTPENVSKTDLGNEILTKIDVRQYVELILSSQDAKDIDKDRDGKSFDEWVDWLADKYRGDEKIPPRLSEECKHCEYRIDRSEYHGKKSGFDECWSEAGKEAPYERARSFDIWGGIREVVSKKKIFFLDELKEEDVQSKTAPEAYEVTNPLGGWTRHERRMLQVDNAANRSNKVMVHPDLAGALDLPSPWHFIDFETAMVAIPFTKGKRPYEQIAFQFSHHVMQDGRIEHKTQWLEATPGVSPNFAFVRALKKALSSDNGTVFRYAAHENTVLNQIHNQLLASNEPDKDELVGWIRSIAEPTGPNESRFPDWKPTRKFVDMLKYVQWFFWHPSMGGSNSIKAVLPAMLSSSNYLQKKYSSPIYGKSCEIKSLNVDKKVWVALKNGSIQDPYTALGPIFPDLEVTREALDDAYGEGEDRELRDGGAAMMAYCRLQFSDLTKEQREFITNALLRYCELDTLAMVMLWEGWLNGPKE